MVKIFLQRKPQAEMPSWVNVTEHLTNIYYQLCTCFSENWGDNVPNGLNETNIACIPNYAYKKRKYPSWTQK
jgi:hypothetical protein